MLWVSMAIINILLFRGSTLHVRICRLRRWANILQMLYKCFVFTGRVIKHVCIHFQISGGSTEL